MIKQNKGQLLLNFTALDKLGKWPVQTYLQRRLAMLKFAEAEQVLRPGEKLKDDNGSNT